MQHLGLLHGSVSVNRQWGNTNECTSETDYRYFPVQFKTMSYFGIASRNLYINLAHCWIVRIDTSKFLIGASNDFEQGENMFYMVIGK